MVAIVAGCRGNKLLWILICRNEFEINTFEYTIAIIERVLIIISSIHRSHPG